MILLAQTPPNGSGSGGNNQVGGSESTLPHNAKTYTDVDEVFRRLELYQRVDPNVASERLHQIKKAAGRGPDDNVIFDATGNVYDPVTREWLGYLTR